ncbi:MAG: amidohydrolase family protein [Planctomycetaceae bacterium]|nr:amidohydrolase family protein [Planctomycetaceae bacterium]
MTDSKIVDFEAHYLDAGLFDLMKIRTTPPFYNVDSKRLAITNDRPETALPLDPSNLLDVGDGRLAAMDEAGIAVQILSSTVPLEASFTPDEATAHMPRMNDRLAETVARHPDRFRGMASLSPHHPEKAAAELRRCVTDLGFVGWHLHSHIDDPAAPYPDAEKYLPIWEAAAELGIYVYIHHISPSLDALHGHGYELFGSSFGFAIDASICMARLILGGLFERYPTLKVMQGHMGETFPFLIERMDHQIATKGKGYKLPLLPGDYWRRNVWCSTSGCYSADVFHMLLQQSNINRIVLGSDYPYERAADSTEFLAALPLEDRKRARIGCWNAVELGIKPDCE